MTDPTTFSLQPAPRARKLAETVAEGILAEIRARQLRPGTRMPSERELMESLDVGRSTVREALNGLTLLGAIEIRQGQGAFVAADPVAHHARAGLSAALAHGVTRDLLEARRPVETEIARLSAQRRTPADLRDIKATLTAYAKCMKSGGIAAEHAAAFHVRLAEAAHSEILAKFVASITPALEERGPALERVPGYREWELAEHTGLYEAVRARDSNAAVVRMLRHLAAVAEYYGDLESVL